MISSHIVTNVCNSAEGACVKVSHIDESCSCKYCVKDINVRFVVACDGSKSAVRKQLGIPLEGTSFSQRVCFESYVPDKCLK